MNDNWNSPFLGRAPTEYDQLYFDNLIRQLTIVLEQIRSVGSLDASTLMLRSLPKSSIGLPAGTIFRDGDVLKIWDGIPAGGLTLTGYAPTVTVT